MNIEELIDKSITLYSDIKNNRCGRDGIIQLAAKSTIENLQELDKTIMNILGNSLEYYEIYDSIEDKIQELKTYLK
jgi:hypothetical protein